MLCLSGFELYSRWVPLLNLYIDAEFALHDTGCCVSKKILHDPTTIFLFFFFNFINKKTGVKEVKHIED